MRGNRTCAALIGLGIVVQGCPGPEEENAVSQHDNEVVGGNALEPNALAPNALAPNALAPETLALNALALNALALNALASDMYDLLLDRGAAGARARLLMKYLVSCALPAGRTFHYTWTDASGSAHNEHYEGQFGLAPAWEDGPLGLADQQMVSACAAARANYYGVQVQISARSPRAPLDAPSDTELSTFPVVEGAFWGNLFDSKHPHLRACYAEANVGNSRSWLRDCAAGHRDAGWGTPTPCDNITIVGTCESLCGALDPAGQFYPSCADPDRGTIDRVITTALPLAPVPGTAGGLALMTSAPPSVTKGACEQAAQAITVTNTGLITAPSPMVLHTLPDGLLYASATTADGWCSAAGSGVACALADLLPGASATIEIKTTPTTAKGPASSTSFVIAAMQESDLGDNVRTVRTNVSPAPRRSWEKSSSNFNSSPITKGRTIWFTVTMKPGDLPEAVTSVWAIDGQVTFSSKGTTYTIPLPDGSISFDPSALSAKATFDPALDRWIISAPRVFAGEVLVSAAAFVAPEDLPGGIKPVTVSLHFVSNKQEIKADWRWAAAVYDSLGRDYNSLWVQPTDDGSKNPINNSDRAGTPELFKAFVVAGGKGKGGNNYTGGHSPSKSGAPELQSSCE